MAKLDYKEPLSVSVRKIKLHFYVRVGRCQIQFSSLMFENVKSFFGEIFSFQTLGRVLLLAASEKVDFGKWSREFTTITALYKKCMEVLLVKNNWTASFQKRGGSN